MTVRVLNPFGDAMAAAIRASVPEAEVVGVPFLDEPPAGTEGEVLLHSHTAPNLLALLGCGVQWLHTYSTGVDGLPTEAFEGRTVTCSRGASAVPIAEWVMATMLAFEKRLPDSWIHEPPKHWGLTTLGGLAGKTLGLVGLGGIGTETARRALAFGMDVVAVRRTSAPSPIDGVTVAGSIDDVLPVADHLVIAAPATARTRHLLDARAFGAMKSGVHLVNVARGTLVDQDALRAALDEGRVAVASLDVCDPEPLPAGHWLYEHPKVRISPHVSWASSTMTDRITELFLDNLRRYLDGQPLEGVVDPAEGY